MHHPYNPPPATIVERLALKHDVVQHDDPVYWREAAWAYGDALLEWAAGQPSPADILAGRKGLGQPEPDAEREPEVRPEAVEEEPAL